MYARKHARPCWTWRSSQYRTRYRIAHFKCPRTVDFVPELPRSATGKLYKRVLRDAYWDGHKTPIV